MPIYKGVFFLGKGFSVKLRLTWKLMILLTTFLVLGLQEYTTMPS
jgi:hypothetical protein